MKTLDEIAIDCQTDRASVFTRTYGKPHDYARHYDKVFSAIRLDPVKLLEIGVGGGEGVQMWLEYFANKAEIFGVDNQRETNPWNTVKPPACPRYRFTHGDQAIQEFWHGFIKEHGSYWDIIIDDGSHVNTDIITTFCCLWPEVKPGGFYAIEDLGTSYGGDSFFVRPNLPSQVEFIKGKVDELNKVSGGIDSIYLAKELCIFRKAT
jgi:hypothetical protein